MCIVNYSRARLVMGSLTLISLLAAGTRLLAQEPAALQAVAATPEATVRSAGEADRQQAVRIERHPAAVQPKECFPIESLSEDLQDLSRSLLLDALDTEALYTLVGDLKPVSDGFFDTWFRVDPAKTDELSRVRQAISAWKCGGHYEVGVTPFQNLRAGKRFASAWVASRPGLRRKMNQHRDFFGRLGLTAESTAEAVLLQIEGADEPADRWQGFGLVFGYPERAVDFFVRAGMHHATTGEFIERDFRNYPTHAQPTGRFVYAVPRLDSESNAERRMRRQVQAILTLYRGHRNKFIIEDNPERVTDLLRQWFDDGSGWCHPDHALQKAAAWDEAREWVESQAIRLTTVNPTESLDDLSALDGILEKPRIIALGESTHGTREFFQLKHRLFRHLVENHGVRLFGIEASYAACLPIDEYVVTGQGNPRAAIKGQGFWTWDTEEVLALVEWMRDWNSQRRANERPVRFYGFDTQDAYTPLKLVLAELQHDAPEEIPTYQERLSLALEEQYGQALNSATRDQLDDLLKTIQELQAFCTELEKRSEEEHRTIQLLLQQASAAIQIQRSQLDQWSSMGMLKELDLYARIRSRLPAADSQLAGMTGEHSEVLLEFIRAAADLKRCQLRFRDELDEEQRQAWRQAVQWGIANAVSSQVHEVLMDLNLFLEISTEYLSKPKELVNARDESMAGFVTNILDLHGESSRIALWAHDWHISKLDGNPIEEMPRMGTYLERQYGSDYLPIGLSFGSGSFQAKYYPEEDEDPARMVLREFKVEGSRADSFSQLFDYVDAPISALLLDDSITDPLPLPRWLHAPQFYRTLGAVYQPRLEKSDAYYEEMVLMEHFEMVLHVRETERARPLSPVARFRFGAQLASDSSPGSSEETTEQVRSGVLVESVVSNSLADKCGLQTGDRIVRLGDREISGKDEFELMLAEIKRPGSHRLDVVRLEKSPTGAADRSELVLYLLVPPWISETD